MKGQVIEITLICVIVAVFFIVVVFGQSVFSDFYSNDPTYTENARQAHISAQSQAGIDVLGNSVMLLFWGALIAMVISAFFIGSHPIFFVASLIVFIITIPVIVMITNFTMDTVTTEELEASAERHTQGLQTVGNLPVIAIIGGVVVMVALYAKFS